MKKLLLTVVAAAAVTAVASAADLNQFWQKSVAGATEESVFKAATAVDAIGNVYATGAFNQDFTLGTTALEAVGTGAYLAKYDVKGAMTWSVGLTGSATINCVTTDADGNVYIAGQIADEVSFGTTSGTAIVKKGLEIDGAATESQCAAFIAKYDATGKIADVLTFIPEGLPALVETGMYYPEDGDLFFHITNLKVDGANIYASAYYNGKTTVGDATFEGSYNDPWFGVYYMDLKCAAVFKLGTDLSSCTKVVECVIPEPLATEDDQYSVQTATFTVYNNTVYATFSGNGPLVVKSAATTKTVTAEASDYNYIVVGVDSENEISKFATKACPDAGQSTRFRPVDMFVIGAGPAAKLYIVGWEDFAENYGEDNERISTEIFVLNGMLASFPFAGLGKATKEFIDGDINFCEVTSAAVLPTGDICINALGKYTASGDGHGKGDFAGASKSLICPLPSQSFTASTIVPDAVGVAANGDFAAFSSITATGADFSLYSTQTPSGIDNIIVDENASEAEYFNLQGVRVAAPAAGNLYIVRRGNKASKEILR